MKLKILNMKKLSASVRKCGVSFKTWLRETQLSFIRRNMMMSGWNMNILLRNIQLQRVMMQHSMKSGMYKKSGKSLILI